MLSYIDGKQLSLSRQLYCLHDYINTIICQSPEAPNNLIKRAYVIEKRIEND